MFKLLRQIAVVGIKTEAPPKPDPALRQLREQLHDAAMARLGRAVAIRHVDAGSCNLCEMELQLLEGPHYHLEALGIRFVASPRHADMLLVTGPVTRHMEAALRATWEAMPHPKCVVAAGDCGCTGGIYRDSYACRSGVASVLPVDVAIPGCPPTPTALMQGILTAVTNFRPP